eukprot:Opistho-2@81343
MSGSGRGAPVRTPSVKTLDPLLSIVAKGILSATATAAADNAPPTPLSLSSRTSSSTLTPLATPPKPAYATVAATISGGASSQKKSRVAHSAGAVPVRSRDGGVTDRPADAASPSSSLRSDGTESLLAATLERLRLSDRKPSVESVSSVVTDNDTLASIPTFVDRSSGAVSSSVPPASLSGVGRKIDALDRTAAEPVWRAARIRHVDGRVADDGGGTAAAGGDSASVDSREECDVPATFVHFEGTGAEYDRWIPLTDTRDRTDASLVGPGGYDDDDKWQKAARRAAESPRSRTGVVYDSRMLLHCCTCPVPRLTHPEVPQRISAILAEMERTNACLDRCRPVPASEVTREAVETCHDPLHVTTYGFARPNQRPPGLKPMECGGVGLAVDTVYNHAHSPLAARLSAGSLVRLCEEVASGRLANGFAVVRPPGHHAEESDAMGFCFFNNVAVAAKRALQMPGIARVLIVDWDVHHGNGTQNIFYDNPNVLYVSLHRHDNGDFYPGTGDADECGSGNGLGFNVNIPWKGRIPMGNTEYLSAFHHVIMPIATEFKPDIVLVSAGFDAADGDEISGYKVTPEAYAHMTRLLMSLASGRVILALEGGYDLESLSASATACLSALLGDQLSLLPRSCVTSTQERAPAVPVTPAVNVLRKVIGIQQKYWRSLQMPRSLEIASDLFRKSALVTGRRVLSAPANQLVSRK